MRTFVRFLARRVTALDKAICTRLGLQDPVLTLPVFLFMMIVTAIGTGVVSENSPWLFALGVLLLTLYCWVLGEMGELEQEGKNSKN